ncbi:MAG: hypothetical protein ACI863_001058, partial [Flavobacteriales bacterium]
MNNWLLYNQYLRFICFFTILFFSIHNSFSLEQEIDDVTTIDLQKTLINNDTEIALDSGWEFYWNELIEPGDFNANKPLALVSLDDWTQFNLSNNEKLPSF